MDCPVCGGRFPVGQIQQHVEQCLIDQDAFLARQVQQQLNDGPSKSPDYSRRPPQQAPNVQQRPLFPNPQTQRNDDHHPPAKPLYQPIPASSGSHHPSTSRATPSQQPTSAYGGAQRPSHSQPDSRVTGAVQADIDTYNAKIASSYKQLQQMNHSLETFASRISLLEQRKFERIVPPVEIPDLPPARYMAIKPTNQAPPQAAQPKGGFVPSPARPTLAQTPAAPTSHEKRNRFFETAQRFYNDKTGANSFFSGVAALAPPASGSSTAAASSSGPKIPGKSHVMVTPSPSHHPMQPKPAPTAHNPSAAPSYRPPQHDGITDMHVAQIESKWIANVLAYPEDAPDLILAHLTMLFHQRIKEKKSMEDPDSDLSKSREGNADGSNSSSKVGSSSGGMAHPVSEYVGSMIWTWNEPFSRMREPTQETIQTAVQMVQGLILTLEDVVLDYYKELSVRNVPKNASQAQYELAEMREQMVRTAVRTAIWPLFYDDVMKLIKSKSSAEDDVCNQKVKEYMTMNPAHLGIPKDYWLIEVEDAGPGVKAWSVPPYYSAIQTFKELPTLQSPESKLKCVVKSARDLVDSVTEFHSHHGRDPNKFPVGGDELLPIFTYVVIRSGVQNLISETSFMELFINDDQARGEMGYILATLQTVIAFLSCLDSALISQSVDSVFKVIAREVERKRAAEEAAAEAKGEEQIPTPDELKLHADDAPSQSLAPSSSFSRLHKALGGEDSSDSSSVELQPVGNIQGSFFDEDSSLSTIEVPEHATELTDLSKQH